MNKIKNIVLTEAKAIRNIYNQKEIDDYIHTLLREKDIQKDNITNWVKNNLKNYLLKEYTNTQLIENLNEVTENWAIMGIKNKTLQRVIIDDEFRAKIYHALDFLQTEYRTKRLDTLAVADAIKQSIDWTENQKKQDDDPDGVKSVMNFDDGYSIVELTSKQALLYEGYKMKHCIGMTYAAKILKGQKRAFSLRDKHNNPHATLMYDVQERVIDEVKGVANSILKIEYQDYLAEFLTQTDLSYTHIYQFNFLPNLHWDHNQQEFYVSDEKKHQATNFYFETPHIDLFGAREKSEYTTQAIRDRVTLGKLEKSYAQIQDIYFHDLRIMTNNNPYELDTLGKLNVNHLNLVLNGTVSRIESRAKHVNIELKNTAHEARIENLDLFEVQELNIQSDNKITIGCLNLKKSQLQRLSLKNVEVEKIFFTDNVLIHTYLNNVSLPFTNLKTQHLHIKQSTTPLFQIQAHTIFAYDCVLNKETTQVSEFLLSNMVQEVECINKLTVGSKELRAPELLGDYISACNHSLDLVDAKQFYSYENQRVLDINYHDKAETQAILQCKPEYHRDMETFFDSISFRFLLFNNIDYLDVPYLSPKHFTKNNLIDNPLFIRPDFLEFLEREENLFGQFVLFENLRCLNEKGLNVAQFTQLLDKPLHPYMKKHIDYIQLNSEYALNNDFYLATHEDTDPKWKKVYGFMKHLHQNMPKEHCLYPYFENIDGEKTEHLFKQLDHHIELIEQDPYAYKNIDQHVNNFFSTTEFDILNSMMDIGKVKLIMRSIFNSAQNEEYSNHSSNELIEKVWSSLAKSRFANFDIFESSLYLQMVNENTRENSNTIALPIIKMR